MSESDYEDDGTETYIVERTMSRRGGRPYATDSIDRKNDKMFSTVYNGAAQLLVTCVGRRNQLEGQLGMVDFGNGRAQAVTALHNITQRWGYSPTFTTCTFSGSRFNETFPVEFPDLCVPSRTIKPLTLEIGDTILSWEYGVDIARGQFQETEHATPPTKSANNYHVFQSVPPDYQFSVGTTIGMAVFAKQAATMESSRMPSGAKVEPADVYGAADEVSIYTGSMTHVGKRFFAHNMNSYRGCSGAIVFLLDGENEGKCVGVHIGSPPEIIPAVNLAIKIHETPVFLSSPSKDANL